jgi:predicted amidohydrolase
MKIALVQLDVDLSVEPGKARESAIAKVHEAAEDGAELVALPELWLHGAFDPEPWAAAAEPMHGETAQGLRDRAARRFHRGTHSGRQALQHLTGLRRRG